MKRIIYKNLILGTCLAALVFGGCSKEYLDVNNDPNRVTDENVTPELIFTQAEVASGARQASGNFGFLNNWMGYFAPNGDFAPNQEEQTYNLSYGFGDALWQNHYNVLFDLHLAKSKALVSGDTAVAGASMVLSAKLFQELVDLYGDIPYSEAFQSDVYSNPKYDPAQDVYNSLLASLDTAVGYLNQYIGSEVPTAFKNADVINSGNIVLWIKFANTIRLRLLIRQSQLSGFNPSGEIAKIQNSAGVLEDGENIDVNPGYVNDVDKQSPFFANYGYDPGGVKANTSTNANLYIVNILSASADPRLGRFFQDVNGNYVGNPYGLQAGDLHNGAGSSYFGPGLIGEDASSGVGASQNQWILPAFESLFLKAEAIARGWMPGDAKAVYEDAVTQSFIWLEVPDATAAAANYLANEDIANWDGGAGSTVDSRVKFIVFQKYIALCGVDPLEAYSDERRLHFLTDNSFLSSNPAASSSLPLRLLYPQSERTTNAASTPNQALGDQFKTKIFWEP